MARLVISAAHTVMAPGEIFQDLREVDLTRKILGLCLPYLDKSGVEYKAVPLDLQLLDRIAWINDTGYSEEQNDIFIEIHINDGGKRGVEGWFSDAAGPDNKSQKLCEYLVSNICKKMSYDSQGAHSEFDHDLGALLVLNQTNQISTAIELLYIDNPDDIAILKDDKKLDELAKNFVDVISDYIKELDKEAPKTNAIGDIKIPDLNLDGITTPATTPAKPTIMMDRDQRKKMIIDVYTKGLGKEPAQKDLDFFLNQGISEDDLIKRLFESKDHAQLVKDAVEAADLKQKITKLESDMAQLQSNLNDINAMHQSLNRLLQHKNALIARLQHELVVRGILKPGEYLDATTPSTYKPN